MKIAVGVACEFCGSAGVEETGKAAVDGCAGDDHASVASVGEGGDATSDIAVVADDLQKVASRWDPSGCYLVDEWFECGGRLRGVFGVYGLFHRDIGFDHVEDFDGTAERLREVDSGCAELVGSRSVVDGDHDRSVSVSERRREYCGRCSGRRAGATRDGGC